MTTKRERKTPTPIELEIRALKKIVDVLESLDDATRTRTLAYVNLAFTRPTS